MSKATTTNEDDEEPTPVESGDQARTRLAAERTYLAGERTMLAWVRTSVAMMGFGFLVARFGLFLHELAEMRQQPAPSSVVWSAWIGTALVMMGSIVNVYAIVERLRSISEDRPHRGRLLRRSSFALALAAALCLLGIALAAYLTRIG